MDKGKRSGAPARAPCLIRSRTMLKETKVAH